MAVIISTELGRLEGDEQGGLAIFRGVPYAAPPVGALRFRPPEPPAPWSSVRAARQPGATAPQLLSIMRDLEPQSEDCLYLNVWTPALAGGRARSGLPVWVFIHGGGFTSGASTHAMYDCRELARRGDAVVVSFNYRLGALGFADLGALAQPGFEASANNGLRDQIAALQWVRRHIDAFGGDPEQVTLLGQSAGAMSVATLLTLDAASGLCRRAIAQSGAAHHVTSRAESGRIAELLVETLGLRPSELARIRELPFEAIVKAQATCQREWVDVGTAEQPQRNANMTLLPVIDGDLIHELPILAAARGAGGDIPLLLGSNRDEWHFWVFIADESKRALDLRGLLPVIEQRLPGRAERACEVYTRALQAQLGRPPAPWQLYSAIETDRLFTLPAVRLAEARARAGAPTFLYRFDWTGPLFEGQMGACHTLELPFVLGLTGEGFGQVFTGGGQDARELSERMMDAWLAFSRAGDPSTAELGAWPGYDSDLRRLMALQREPRLESGPSAALLEFWSECI